MRRVCSLVLCLFAFTGCASSKLTNDGKMVKVIDRKASEACDFVGYIHKINHRGMDYTQKIINSTLDAKNEAATLNANALVIIDTKFEFPQGGITKANAFRCDFK